MSSRPKVNTYDVYVGNLPMYVEKHEIENLFKSCGELCNVVLLYSKYSRSKIAYVKYYCEPDAKKAIYKYGSLGFHGHQLEVKMATPKTENQGSNSQNASILKSPHGGTSGNKACKYSANLDESNGILDENPTEFVVVVCHVENPVTFHGHSLTNLLQLTGISNRLQEFCSKFSQVIAIPEIDQIYAGRFTEDHMWYRCRIIQHVDKNKSAVSYIDYGNKEELDNKEIVLLPDDLVRIPPQSSRYILKDLKPIFAESNRDVYSNAIQYMQQIVNKKIQVRAVYSGEGVSLINKCVFQNVDIYDELQKKGFAQKESSASPQKYQMKVPGMNENNGDFLPNSKATHKSSNNKSNTRNANSVNNVPNPATTSKKSSHSKHTGKEYCEDLEKLRKQNDKLSRELTMERKKSVVLKQELDALKAKADSNHLEKLESVILKTQQLYAMRDQSSSEDNNLEEVYDVIKAKLPCSAETSDSDLHMTVEEAVSKYLGCVNSVGECEKAELLPVHIKERDEACKTACNIMKEYLESWNGDRITGRVAFLKELLLEMEQKYEKYLKVDVDCQDRSLTELLGEYRENKAESKTSLDTLVKNTDNALNRFSSIIGDLQKDIAVPSDKSTNVAVNGICIRFSTAKFLESLEEVKEAVDTEIIAKSLEPKSPPNEAAMASLVTVLVKEIKTPLEAALQEMQDCKTYNLLYPELCNNLRTSPDTSKIYEIRKAIKTLKSKLRHKLADKKDLEESDELNTTDLTEINSSIDLLLHELHSHFKEEHGEMMKLVQLYRTHFRELGVHNPDLNLLSYSKCDGLLKENWEIEHFNFCTVMKRPGICYSTEFCDESVIIKEYHLNNGEYDEFFEKIKSWNSIKEDNVVPIHAVFRSKVGLQTYAVFPHFMTLEEQSEKEFPFAHGDAGQVLHDVLKGLECVHSQSLTHSMLNPSTVLIKSSMNRLTSVLDFSFGLNQAAAPWESKGIIFCPPEKKLSQDGDMYNFGCLILWILFPNLQFPLTSDIVVDVAGYKSILEGLLSPSGYEIVEALLSVEPSKRPSAKSLLEKDFFMEMCKNCGDDPSHISTPASQTSENSVVVSVSLEELSDTASVDAASVDTASVGTASVDTASVGTASVDTASVGTASVDTASFDTASVSDR